MSLYKAATALLRAYANIADDMNAAGYDDKKINEIKKEVKQATEARNTVRLAAGEYLDTKPFEADMRHLIDNYIEAKNSTTVADFGDLSLVDMIVNKGMEEIIKKFPKNVSKNEKAATAVITNNIRTVIKKKRMHNLVFFDKMSAQLNEIIELLREGQIDYAEFLRRIAELARFIKDGRDNNTPDGIKTPGQHALYDYLKGKTSNAAELAGLLDQKIQDKKPADWRGSISKEQQIKGFINEVINHELNNPNII